MSAAEETGTEDPDTDEEQVEREWHIWLLALLVVGGIGLAVAPGDIVPGLVAGLGPLFVILGVVGWLFLWAYKRWGD